jgi:protein disulfide-isomerase A6
VLANVVADSAVNRPLAERYKIGSFPTIKFFSKDNKEPEDYDGGRTEEDFVAFLNEKCGTQRAVGGGLNDVAGRLPEFDALASKFFTAASSARESVYQEALALAGAGQASGKHYLRVMEKVVNGTEGYLEKEAKRCVMAFCGATPSDLPSCDPLDLAVC